MEHHVVNLGLGELIRHVQGPAAVERPARHLFAHVYPERDALPVEERSQVRRENLELIPPIPVRYAHSEHLPLPHHGRVTGHHRVVKRGASPLGGEVRGGRRR